MSTNHTPNYALSLWEASDQVVRTEFNENHAKIDAALGTLSVGLTDAETALAGKLERGRIVKNYNPMSGTGTCYIYDAPNINWNEYEYVCVLVKYGDSVSGAVPTFALDGTNSAGKYTKKTIAPLALPGYLVVFLPWHDATRNAAGFIIADRLIPFTTNIPFQSLDAFHYEIQNNVSTPCPKVTAFGGK